MQHSHCYPPWFPRLGLHILFCMFNSPFAVWLLPCPLSILLCLILHTLVSILPCYSFALPFIPCFHDPHSILQSTSSTFHKNILLARSPFALHFLLILRSIFDSTYSTSTIHIPLPCFPSILHLPHCSVLQHYFPHSLFPAHHTAFTVFSLPFHLSPLFTLLPNPFFILYTSCSIHHTLPSIFPFILHSPHCSHVPCHFILHTLISMHCGPFNMFPLLFCSPTTSLHTPYFIVYSVFSVTLSLLN